MSYRSNLLAEYLQSNPCWIEMMEVFDTVYGDRADLVADKLSKVRDLYQLNSKGLQVAADKAKDFSAFDLPDRETLVQTCLTLGFTYPNVQQQLFSTEDYLRIAQSIAAYYRDQGTDSFIKFFSYCLNARFELANLWTQDYVTFVSENDPDIGVPVWFGGEWYPTSHVNLSFDSGKVGSDVKQILRDFFNYLAPINLVLLHLIEAYYAEIHLNIAMAGSVTILYGAQPTGPTLPL